MPHFLVRAYSPNDVAAVIALWTNVLPSSNPWNNPTSELHRKIERADELVLVGEVDGKVYATIVAGYDGIRGWIYRLAVATDQRRRGLGRAMLQAAENELRKQGCPKVNLQVRSDNLAAIEFYNRCGYALEDRASLGKRLAPLPSQRPEPPGMGIGPQHGADNAIQYQVEPNLSATEFTDVLQRATLAERRPVDDIETIEAMLRHAQLIITARKEGLLIGVSRAISDFAYSTYLSDLAVDVAFQRRGIGKELIHRTHKAAGLNTTLILLSAPAAVNYYPRIGMLPADSCWITPRTT